MRVKELGYYLMMLTPMALEKAVPAGVFPRLRCRLGTGAIGARVPAAPSGARRSDSRVAPHARRPAASRSSGTPPPLLPPSMPPTLPPSACTWARAAPAPASGSELTMTGLGSALERGELDADDSSARRASASC
mmetsp:Transcript_2574/g.6769  ORF Transcript_2574/g.6769 Transcript_2574/m.6769 type:complete len:134 (-) Transcript_2574:186-587(-)